MGSSARVDGGAASGAMSRAAMKQAKMRRWAKLNMGLTSSFLLRRAGTFLPLGIYRQKYDITEG
jgi:hypothetical protein